jgi:hypothetical protein
MSFGVCPEWIQNICCESNVAGSASALTIAFHAFSDMLQMLQDLPQCGTNLAATDGVVMVQALIASEPAPDAVITAASKAAAAAVVTRFLEAGGVPALLQVEC